MVILTDIPGQLKTSLIGSQQKKKRRKTFLETCLSPPTLPRFFFSRIFVENHMKSTLSVWSFASHPSPRLSSPWQDCPYHNRQKQWFRTVSFSDRWFFVSGTVRYYWVSSQSEQDLRWREQGTLSHRICIHNYQQSSLQQLPNNYHFQQQSQGKGHSFYPTV